MSIKKSLQESARLLDDMAQRIDLVSSISEVSSLFCRTLRSGNKLIFAGNGGSASQAEHIAGEFVGKFLMERRAMPAMSLTVNSATLTAIANDSGYEEVFARQLEAFGQSGDVFVCLSTSGKSKNLIKACEYARKNSITTVCLVGLPVSELSEKCEYEIHVPSQSTPRIQEAHIVIGHILAERVEKEMFS
jgi:D-sedoheptulose 7-phosphate isomerase